MKKCLILISIFLGALTNANATDLMQVYQQSLTSDQIFQQAVSQRLSTKEGVPISLSALLPAASFSLTPSVSTSNTSGTAATMIGSSTDKGYTYSLNLTQTVFNFSQFANLCNAFALSKQADATLNAASQSLMLRVASAYFAVLNDEDTLRYTQAAKDAFAKQLDQVKQQFNVGLKTITDVYTAQASYESSSSDVITAQTQLANDKENLRVITGVYYPHLSRLSENFPLISPQPAIREQWVQTAQRQNWSIKAAQYTADAARQTIRQQFGGHLPTLQAQGSYSVLYDRTIASTNTVSTVTAGANPTGAVGFRGSNQTNTSSAALVLSVPLVQGGFVVAATKQAKYNYQLAMSQLDQTVLTTINTTRQSYLGVLAGISKVQADREAIKSTISSLEGLKAAYQVGTETLVNVVNQQQNVVRAQRQYAGDRYSYVNNLLALKAAAGTLSPDDLQAINSWLVNDSDDAVEDAEYKASVALPTLSARKTSAPHHAAAKTQTKKMVAVAKKPPILKTRQVTISK